VQLPTQAFHKLNNGAALVSTIDSIRRLFGRIHDCDRSRFLVHVYPDILTIPEGTPFAKVVGSRKCGGSSSGCAAAEDLEVRTSASHEHRRSRWISPREFAIPRKDLGLLRLQAIALSVPLRCKP
jgi:hypothetical protein